MLFLLRLVLLHLGLLYCCFNCGLVNASSEEEEQKEELTCAQKVRAFTPLPIIEQAGAFTEAVVSLANRLKNYEQELAWTDLEPPLTLLMREHVARGHLTQSMIVKHLLGMLREKLVVLEALEREFTKTKLEFEINLNQFRTALSDELSTIQRKIKENPDPELKNKLNWLQQLGITAEKGAATCRLLEEVALGIKYKQKAVKHLNEHIEGRQATSDFQRPVPEELVTALKRLLASIQEPEKPGRKRLFFSAGG